MNMEFTSTNDFIDFLRTEGCMDRYINNIMSQQGYTIESVIKRSKKDRTFDNIINNTLNWRDTPEGQEFWARKNKKWKEIFHSNKTFIHKCKSIW